MGCLTAPGVAGACTACALARRVRAASASAVASAPLLGAVLVVTRLPACPPPTPNTPAGQHSRPPPGVCTERGHRAAGWQVAGGGRQHRCQLVCLPPGVLRGCEALPALYKARLAASTRWIRCRGCLLLTVIANDCKHATRDARCVPSPGPPLLTHPDTQPVPCPPFACSRHPATQLAVQALSSGRRPHQPLWALCEDRPARCSAGCQAELLRVMGGAGPMGQWRRRQFLGGPSTFNRLRWRSIQLC